MLRDRGGFFLHGWRVVKGYIYVHFFFFLFFLLFFLLYGRVCFLSFSGLVCETLHCLQAGLALLEMDLA